MQSSIRNYLLYRNKSGEGILACNMKRTCQNNMLDQEILSQTLIFKEKKAKISLKQLTAKTRGRHARNELFVHQDMMENDYLHRKNPEQQNILAKRSIQQTQLPQLYQQLPLPIKSSTSFTQSLRIVPHKQTYTSQCHLHYQDPNSQCEQNECHLFRNVFDSPNNHSSSKQLQTSRSSQQSIKILKKPLTYDLSNSQSISSQNEQIISQHPQLSKDLQISFAISFHQQPYLQSKQLLETNDREGYTPRGKMKFLETKGSFVSQCSSASSCQESIVVGKSEPKWVQFKNQLWNL